MCEAANPSFHFIWCYPVLLVELDINLFIGSWGFGVGGQQVGKEKQLP